MSNKLNPDVWKQFDKGGKSEFVKFIKLSSKDSDHFLLNKNGGFNSVQIKAIHELIWQFLNKNVRKETILQVFSEIATTTSDASSAILDVLNNVDCETSVNTDAMQDERLLFLQLLKDLSKVIPENLIKERLEIDTLQDAGIVKNRLFYSKFIKIKTKLYYKQRRFNLFREESEGYSKLISELNQEFDENRSAASVMDIIKSLIGCFNLDPNRVLDVILESFETRLSKYRLFIQLLRSYMPNSTIISEVLGYKFRHFAENNEVTPFSLYQITALLLKYGVINLTDIYVWLSPLDSTITENWHKSIAEANEFVRKMNVILTNKDSDPVEPEQYNPEEGYMSNQKFGLCEALLKVGDWENSLTIINQLPEQCVLVHELIAKALADIVHVSIDRLYSTKCFNSKQKKSRLYDDKKLLKEIQANSYNDLLKHAFPMTKTLGPSLRFDTILINKLLRIMKKILTEMNVDNLNLPASGSDDEILYNEIINVLDSAIFPALSYLDCNCCVAEEIWLIVKFFPYSHRYSLYARWKNESYTIHPELIRRRGIAQKNIKALMKRVSKDNVKPIGRLIGKLSHCASGILFDYILLQIQIYDNLIGPVVDSFKYLTNLSFDMLGYCIVESLTKGDRDRFRDDGTSLSMWLQSLASFCGSIYKKYNIELSGLLQYVANQLKSQKSLDLLILKEVVQKMAGVESAEEFTNEQLNAMSGGELLRGEAGYFSQVRNTKKSSQRLKDALASNDLAVALCLLMAQQKHCVIYRETAQNHLKLVGKLYDQCQDTLVQFGTFLGSSYSVDEYVERLPSIITMLQDYHINTDVAFFLARPMFSHQINQKYDQLRKSDPNSKKLTSSQKLQKYLEATQAIINPIVESVRPLYSLKIWEDISPQFLVTFWSLSMYDLQVPVDTYKKEIDKLSLLSSSKDVKSKKEQERYLALMEKLQDEQKKQEEHVNKIKERLFQEKDNWFLTRSARSAKNDTITQFLQLCLFPRCTFTALDAIYCAKFVQTIHKLKTVNFSTILCYDRIFCDITFSVTSFTENEANRYGRFLCAMLETAMSWHNDQATFNRECTNYPGFVTKFRVSNQFSEANDHVGYENYRHVCHKWHFKITKALLSCLTSKDYMQIRNALIILMRILPHFPVLVNLAQVIERKTEKVREDEKNQRPDLFVLASSYIAQLKTRQITMIKESDFHQISEKTKESKTDDALMKIDSNGNSSNGNNIVIKTEPKEIKNEKKVIKSTAAAIIIPESEQIIEIKEEPTDIIKIERSKESRKEERARERERSERLEKSDRLERNERSDRNNDRAERERERDRELAEELAARKRKEEKKRDRSPHYNSKHSNADTGPQSPIYPNSPYYYRGGGIGNNDYEKESERERDRDLSSVSNSSNGSLRRSQEIMQYDKESKRRKMDSSSSKKQQEEIPLESSSNSRKDRERSSKTKERNKEKANAADEDKDSRKERKLGRKRERLEENSSSDHKRRREVQNGDDREDREKYHLRSKSPRSERNERTHEKIRYENQSPPRSERERSRYNTKSQSRINYT